MDVLSVRLLATNPCSPHVTSQTRARSSLFFLSIDHFRKQLMSIGHFQDIYIYVVMPSDVQSVGGSTAD